MTDEVGDIVIEDCYRQTHSLSITELRGGSALKEQAQFITALERSGKLDRALEFIPSDEEIAERLALGKGFWQVFIAVGLTMWVEVARIVRGQVMSVKQMQYVNAAKALGFNNFRIITKHILPNSMAPVIIISAANFAAAILIESGLSFLGIGAQPPMPSWGGIIKDHYSYIILGKPYLAIIPGLAIMSLVTAFMLIGNALRDALDVKN